MPPSDQKCEQGLIVATARSNVDSAASIRYFSCMYRLIEMPSCFLLGSIREDSHLLIDSKPGQLYMKLFFTLIIVLALSTPSLAAAAKYEQPYPHSTGADLLP